MTPEQVIEAIQRKVIEKDGVLHYDPKGYDAMKEVIEEYGKVMFQKGTEKR